DVTALLRQRHHTSGDNDDFTVQNLSSIAQTAQQTTQVFTYLLGGISAVSLLVGGIGIMNIMLVSVTERTREIGLRKALGARQSDILHQFGLEAVTLSVAGGIVGLVLGIVGAWGMTSLFNLPLVISPLNAALALGFAGLVGVVFGAYPAWRAARLDPIEALRREGGRNSHAHSNGFTHGSGGRGARPRRAARRSGAGGGACPPPLCRRQQPSGHD